MGRRAFEDDEDMYIPDIGDVDEEIGLHENPRSNVGVALDWSPFEQQLFDLLHLYRVGTYEREIRTDMSEMVSHLLKTFKPYEVARIASATMLAFQLKSLEGKDFDDELSRYREYVKNHPEDIEEVQV
ncbi:MAG: hypothetical protein IJT06_02865 [Selenomonadaceae bacterium]|nr:hypothetical protein [Selenomonadaceae bacterium]